MTGRDAAAGWPFTGLAPGSARVIYADPPWRFDCYSAKGEGRAPQRHYGCMSLDDIKALPVERLAAADCALFLWVIKPMVPQSLDLIQAWGFTYKTVAFTWVKTRPSGREFINTGYWTRGNPEQCLLATRGRPQRASRGVRELIDLAEEFDDGGDTIWAHAREHSRKPDAVRERIGQLMAPGDGGDMVELFARTSAAGWRAWGNEVEKFPQNQQIAAGGLLL